MKHSFFSVIALLFLFLSPVLADELIFNNGDSLKGQFSYVEDEKVVFDSEIAGEIKIELSKVKEIRSEHQMEITLKDGYILGDKVYRSKDYSEDNPVSTIDLPGPEEGWSGSVSAGLYSQHGNTFTEYITVYGNVSWRYDVHRLRLDGYYLYSRDENDEKDKYTSSNEFFIRGEYNVFVREKDFLYGRISFKKNRLDNLDYRIIGSIGVGRQWFDTKKFQLSLDSGLAYLKEKFSSTLLIYDENEDKYYEQEFIREETQIATQAGVHLNWKPYDKIHIISDLITTSAFGDFSDYYLNSNVELRVSLTKSFYTSFQVLFDYDSIPGQNTDSTDIRYLIGFGWRF